MNAIDRIFSAELTEALGWTIVHSLWQASLIALLLFGVLWLLRHKSAQIKYFIAFTSLIGILGWSAATFVNAYRYAAEKQEAKAKVLHDPLYLKTLLKSVEKTDAPTQTQTVQTTNLGLIKTRAFFQKHFQLICMLWLIGMVFLMCRFMGGLFYAQRLKKRQLIAISNHWLAHIDLMAAKLGISRKITAFCSPLTKVPVTLGTFKPIVLFPITAFTGLSPSAIEAIIAHELAHVMRHDYLFNILQSVIDILFFYHPAIWFISMEIRAERENSCDNIAIGITGNKLEYAKALAAVETNQHVFEPQLSMAFVGRKGTVLQRIKRLQKHITMKTNFNEGIIAAVIIVTGLALASFTLGNKPQDPVAKTTKTVTVKATPVANTDSIKAEIEMKVQTADKNNPEAKELKKVIELAYSENDSVDLSNMMIELNQAMKDINLEKMLQQVMGEVNMALKNASVEVEKAKADVDKEQIRKEMEEARKDIENARKEMVIEIRRDMKADGANDSTIEATIRLASTGLDIAGEVVANIDVENIVNSAMNTLSVTLKSLGDLQIDTTAIRAQTKEDLDQQMKALEEQMKQLEKQQEALKKQMSQMKKEQK